MLVCEECFANEELRADVSNSTMFDTCDVCHKHAKVKVFGDYEDFFSDLLSLFDKSDGGKSVATFIQDEWNIFRDEETARVLLTEMLLNGDFGYGIDDSINYKTEIIEGIDVWERLKTSVRQISRFFTSIDEFDQNHYLSADYELNAGDVLYRARIMSDDKAFTCEQMGCPPISLTKPGRANPIGIPYLYLCDNAKTTYYEVRAVYLDNLSIGKFQITKNLKLVDFTYTIDIYGKYVEGSRPLQEVVIQKKVIESISKDLSKPLRRFDSELEYVPTQMICEYCKSIVLADGISFESSLYKGGKNYVLFDSSTAKCIDVETHTINKIDIDKF